MRKKLENFEWNFKNNQQIMLDFGKYKLSIVRDGYGGKTGHYEIGCFKGNEMVELPGITEEGDTVKGWLTEDDINGILVKMTTISAKDPEQIMPN